MPKSYIIHFLKKKAWLCLGFFFACYVHVCGQNQSQADSLDAIHIAGTFNEEDHMELLADLIEVHPDPDRILEFCDELIQRAEEANDRTYSYLAYVGKGQALRMKGNLPLALENLYRANEIAFGLNDQEKIGRSELTIADVFLVMGNYERSIAYYQSSVKRLRQTNDSSNVSRALINMGDAYNLMNKPDSALLFLEDALIINEALKDDLGIAYSKGNIGISFALKAEIRKPRSI